MLDGPTVNSPRLGRLTGTLSPNSVVNYTSTGFRMTLLVHTAPVSTGSSFLSGGTLGTVNWTAEALGPVGFALDLYAPFPPVTTNNGCPAPQGFTSGAFVAVPNVYHTCSMLLIAASADAARGGRMSIAFDGAQLLPGERLVLYDMPAPDNFAASRVLVQAVGGTANADIAVRLPCCFAGRWSGCGSVGRADRSLYSLHFF